MSRRLAVPTEKEVESLVASGSQKKQGGHEYAGGKLFLPAAGRYHQGDGLYWCSSGSFDNYSNDSATCFAIAKNGDSATGWHYMSSKTSVRCV